ncbi:MAG TPA: hemerythrin family protein [Terracidiphilus sp.]|nr:hemerythrin family protein [Terracidiphilus sp.]
MSGLAWSHASVVGVQAMDDQHGILMDSLNELRVQLARGSSRDKVNRQLELLVEFTGLHFECEERLLERHGFPDIDVHREEHRRMLHAIRELVDRSAHGEACDLNNVLNLLRCNFAEHVEGLDTRYGGWLNAQGIY